MLYIHKYDIPHATSKVGRETLDIKFDVENFDPTWGFIYGFRSNYFFFFPHHLKASLADVFGGVWPTDFDEQFIGLRIPSRQLLISYSFLRSINWVGEQIAPTILISN